MTPIFSPGDKVRIIINRGTLFPRRDTEGIVVRLGRVKDYYWVKLENFPEMIFRVECLVKV